MYTKYWGFQKRPFENTADTSFFVRNDSHQAALLKLRYLVENHQGLGMLCGEVGCGKSMVATMLAKELPEPFRPIASIVYPRMTAPELMAYIAAELGDEQAVGNDPRGLDVIIRRLHAQLHKHAAEGRAPVIVIDEAHLIDDPDVFTSLRLLLNFRQPPRVDFTLIFVGDLSLPAQIQRIAALDDRIAVKSLVQPLTRSETETYILKRLSLAGSRTSPFSDEAYGTVFELTGGLPRRINRLCDLALLISYADGLEQITPEEIESVAQELITVVPD